MHFLSLCIGMLVVVSIKCLSEPICKEVQSATKECHSFFLKNCDCGCKLHGQQSEQKLKFVVNCTDKGFIDADILQKLPPQTEVLIFKGNDISSLPWNLFGNANTSNLKEIDMSSNKIREILGKSFHRVRSVERLTLNNNKLKISRDQHHPRIFSNFENLRELHLTNAFEDSTPEDLAEDLHDIFVQSNLTRLIKLHLEQNEIRTFKDPRIFCDLPSLMDIYLGDNFLEGLDFDFKCLPHLRFIDLERNKISSLHSSVLSEMDSLPNEDRHFMIELINNPLMCDCTLKNFAVWLNGPPKVRVRNNETLTCANGYPKENIGKPVKKVQEFECVSLQMYSPALEASHTSIPVLIGFLVCLLVLLLGTLVYMNRVHLRYRLTPILDTVSRKVQYTSIGKDQEMDV